MRHQNKLYQVQRNIDGDWQPVLLKRQEGQKERVPKTVKITEDTAAEMNRDAETWNGPRNPHLRYFPIEETPSEPKEDGDELPKYGEMKKELKEAGVSVPNTAKKPEVIALYKEHILGE